MTTTAALSADEHERVARLLGLLAIPGAFTTPVRVSDEQALAWVRSDAVSEPTMACWLDLGVAWPQDRPAGFTPYDVQRLIDCGVIEAGSDFSLIDPGWAAVGTLCPDLIQAGLDAGRSGGEIVALCTALVVVHDAGPGTFGACLHHGHTAQCAAVPEVTEAVLADLAQMSDLNWADVATCLRAGMSVQQARAHVGSGAEMGPVRLLVALTG